MTYLATCTSDIFGQNCGSLGEEWEQRQHPLKGMDQAMMFKANM